MKTMLYAFGALALATSAAVAEPAVTGRSGDPVSASASDKPSVRGDREAGARFERSAPVSLDRTLEFESQPLAIKSGRSGRTGWSGNDNDG